MTLKSSENRYGAVAVSIHWVTAALILALIGSGFRAGGPGEAAVKAEILRFHIPMAMAVLVLTIGRLVWWWRFDRKPAPVAGSIRWQERTAYAVHFLFYVVIFGMIASGVGMLALSGAAPIIFGGVGGSLPDFHKYPPHIPHGVGASLLIVLVIVHTGAALYHHFIRRDGLIRRMWFAN
ncbi:superoxide oxidase [Hyphomicrobium sp. 1Nfss2.1]|uniref:cytochrome b n=1 Tax=Hyphomicrobium sp. 1Nfss2.1 TaxID=3413936 RepID=UPI003C7D75C2